MIRDVGLAPIEYKASVYKDGFVYASEEVWDHSARTCEKYFRSHRMKDVIGAFDEFHDWALAEISEMIKSDEDLISKLKKMKVIFGKSAAFIWVTHGMEHFFKRRIENEVPKYIHGNIDSFVSGASFPEKRTAHAIMEDMILIGKSSEEIIAEFGWLKVRNVFKDRPFTKTDIDGLRKTIKRRKTHRYPQIPEGLKGLFEEVRELAYFRVARTEIHFKLLARLKPVFEEVARYFDISFREVDDYPIDSLISGNLTKPPLHSTVVGYEGETVFTTYPVVESENTNLGVREFSGLTAYKGFARGTAKIVLEVYHLSKVSKGDILVTQMTLPAFITAIEKAAAFVTDEGGITCHAAIVAREMKKPCIIGTRIATKVLKDGDIIEVNADNGTVKIVKRSS